MKKIKYELPFLLSHIVKIFVIGFLMTYAKSYIDFVQSILGEGLNSVLLFISLGLLGAITIAIILFTTLLLHIIIKKKFS